MANKTPAKINIHNIGDHTLYTMFFPDIDSGDTYQSSIAAIVNYWFNATDDPTQTNEGVIVSANSMIFTFQSAEGNRQGTLFVMAKA